MEWFVGLKKLKNMKKWNGLDGLPKHEVNLINYHFLILQIKRQEERRNYNNSIIIIKIYDL